MTPLDCRWKHVCGECNIGCRQLNYVRADRGWHPINSAYTEFEREVIRAAFNRLRPYSRSLSMATKSK